MTTIRSSPASRRAPGSLSAHDDHQFPGILFFRLTLALQTEIGFVSFSRFLQKPFFWLNKLAVRQNGRWEPSLRDFSFLWDSL